AVEVLDAGDGGPEPAVLDFIRGGEGVEEGAGGRAEHVRAPGTLRARARPLQARADEEVGAPVAVEVRHPRDGVAESAVGLRIRGREHAEGRARRAVEHVDPAARDRGARSEGRDGEVAAAVAADIAEARDGVAESAALPQVRAGEGVEEGAGRSTEDVGPAGVGHHGELLLRSDEEVAAAVAVEVVEAGDGTAEVAATERVGGGEGVEEVAGGPAEHVRPAVV